MSDPNEMGLHEKEPDGPKNGCLIIFIVLTLVAGFFILFQDVLFS